ncbi:hypothetical protein HMSSN139_37310 [Paenibacillus sp. HMSSN-139]|nr:hypothetical protein HMSSN139_37310 [Paenibacillus sp. HMSSN-139]
MRKHWGKTISAVLIAALVLGGCGSGSGANKTASEGGGASEVSKDGFPIVQERSN